MPAAFLRARAGDEFEAFSAGLEPRPIHPLTYQAMKEIGIDIKGQESKGVDEIRHVGGFLFSIIVCASAEENCPGTIEPAAIRLVWPFDDPSRFKGTREEHLRLFRSVRDAIRIRIDQWLKDEVRPIWPGGAKKHP